MTKKVAQIFLLLLPVLCIAQENTDLQLRLTPSISYKINKKWEFSGMYRYDLYKDLQEFRSSVIQFETRYSISKRFRLDAGYRIRTSFRKDTHRLFAGLRYDQKIHDDFKIFIATKYQFSTLSFDEQYLNNSELTKHMFREEFELKYNIPKSKLSLFVGTEFFLKLDEESDELRLNRIRSNGGLGYDFKYGNSVELSVFYDDRNRPQATDRIVLTAKYNLAIDELIKKIKKDKKKKAKTNS